MNTTKLGGRNWAVLLLFGLIGQFAWTIENMYFNVFLYNTIMPDTDMIASMVAASAIVATLTALFMGVLSDRIGKRKTLMTFGYILWGLSTLSFSFITVENAGKLFPAANAAVAAAVMVVVLDCVMTFFGSTANDAAFNAWVTDVTNKDNRGKAETVLATLPLISMLIIFGAFDSLTQQGKWSLFFTIFGVAVTVCGIVGIFLIKDSPTLEKNKENYFKNIFYGFRPRVIRESPMLYLVFALLLVFCVAVQVFFPFLIIYMQHYLGFDNYAIVLGVVLIVASVVSVLMGKVIDRAGKLTVLLPSLAVMFLGLIGMSFAKSMVFVMIAGSVMMSGYMLCVAAISGLVRDYTPTGKVGHFQGIRMIFNVLLPMVIGPFIGSAVIKNSGGTYIDLGVEKQIPTPSIFLASGAVLVLAAVVVIIIKRKEKRNIQQ